MNNTQPGSADMIPKALMEVSVIGIAMRHASDSKAEARAYSIGVAVTLCAMVRFTEVASETSH
jgi:hypothetical protein